MQLNSVRTFVSILIVLFLAGCESETPNRDRIPELKESLYKLQVAVKSGETIRIDSLLSPDIDDHKQGTDSLLSFVYGEVAGFEFVQFAKAEIFYTQSLARIDCFIIGASDDTERPVTLTFELDDDHWLLKHFESGHTPIVPVETE